MRPRWGSNPPKPVRQTGVLTRELLGQSFVQPPGIEPGPHGLQPGARTSYAKAA